MTLRGSLLEPPDGMARPLGTPSALVPIQRGQAQPSVATGPLHYYRQPRTEKVSRNQKGDDVREGTFALLHAQRHAHRERGDAAPAAELLRARQQVLLTHRRTPAR